MCGKAIEPEGWILCFVPNQYKTQEMSERAVEKDSRTLTSVSDQRMTKEMCERAIENKGWKFCFVPGRYNTQRMSLFLMSARHMRFVTDLPKSGYLHFVMSLISIRPRRCLKEPSKEIHMHWNISLMSIKQRKCLKKCLRKT